MSHPINATVCEECQDPLKAGEALAFVVESVEPYQVMVKVVHAWCAPAQELAEPEDAPAAPTVRRR